jgi:hypothetical protein
MITTLTSLINAEVLTDINAHNRQCELLGITKMSPVSFKIMKARQRAGHILYWYLRREGIENIEAEQINAEALEALELY